MLAFVFVAELRGFADTSTCCGTSWSLAIAELVRAPRVPLLISILNCCCGRQVTASSCIGGERFQGANPVDFCPQLRCAGEAATAGRGRCVCCSLFADCSSQMTPLSTRSPAFTAWASTSSRGAWSSIRPSSSCRCGTATRSELVCALCLARTLSTNECRRAVQPGPRGFDCLRRYQARVLRFVGDANCRGAEVALRGRLGVRCLAALLSISFACCSGASILVFGNTATAREGRAVTYKDAKVCAVLRVYQSSVTRRSGSRTSAGWCTSKRTRTTCRGMLSAVLACAQPCSLSCRSVDLAFARLAVECLNNSLVEGKAVRKQNPEKSLCLIM